MGRSPFIGDKPHESISLCVYGDETGLRMRNNPNDPMSIKIANGKTLKECIHYQGGGITVYTDNAVIVKTYPGFYDYYLANERKMSEIMMLPIEGEEIAKDEKYYKKLINGLAIDYNKQVENAPNLYKESMVLQDVNTPAPIDFACLVFADGQIWIGPGYSVGTADRPPCPVNVPSGKLAFVTNATSETHSFVIKNTDCVRTTLNANPIIFGNSSTDNERYEGYDKNKINNFLISKEIKKTLYSDNVEYNLKIISAGKYDGTLFNIGNSTYQTGAGWRGVNSFTQLLIYKANLTETELKGENAKTIRLR